MQSTEQKIISRPALVSYKEFKERAYNSDGFRKNRRIIYYGYDSNESRYKYRIPMVGRKENCLKEAYRLLFLETDEEERAEWIAEGGFKIAISWNFNRWSLPVPKPQPIIVV